MSDWSDTVGFRHLPTEGVHAVITEVYPAAQPPAQSLATNYIDIATEDVVALMVISDLHGSETDEPPDEIDRVYINLAVFTGRVPRWNVWISQDAALLIRQYFETPELRQELLGTGVLQDFESMDVREVRDTEVAAVAAIWRGIEAEA